MTIAYNPYLKPPLGTTINKAIAKQLCLSSLWLENEGAGNSISDLSGNNPVGVFVGNPVWKVDNQGYTIDFSDDAINIGGNIYDRCASELTIIVKLKWDGVANTYAMIIDKYPGVSIYKYPTLQESLCFYGKIGGTGYDVRWVSAKVVSGEEAVWALRLGNGFQECYKNGKLSDAALAGGPYAGNYDIGTGVNAYIGNSASDMARDWSGLISYMMIFNRALTAFEIAHLYREPFYMFRDSNEAAILGSYVTAGGISIPLVMQQMDQFNGGVMVA